MTRNFSPLARMALTALLLVGTTLASAESTRVIDLQQRLNYQSQVFDQRMQKMENLADSQVEVNDWFEQARSLPPNSTDFQHAQAKFVNARTRLLTQEVTLVQELREVNEDLYNTVDHLVAAIEDSDRPGARENLNRLGAEGFGEAVDQLRGTEQLMKTLRAQGVVKNHPELAHVEAAFRQQARRIVNRSSGSGVDQAGYLRELQAVIEAQGVLMTVVFEDLRQKYQGLQALQITGTTRLVGDQLQQVLAHTVSYFASDGSDRDWDMIETLQQRNASGWTDFSDGSDGSLGTQLDALAERGPVR